MNVRYATSFGRSPGGLEMSEISQKQKFAPLPLLLYTYENFRRTYLGKSCEPLPEEAMR